MTDLEACAEAVLPTVVCTVMEYSSESQMKIWAIFNAGYRTSQVNINNLIVSAVCYILKFTIWNYLSSSSLHRCCLVELALMHNIANINYSSSFVSDEVYLSQYIVKCFKILSTGTDLGLLPISFQIFLTLVLWLSSYMLLLSSLSMGQ